ncbi:MAG: arsenical pump-driving ATPase [Cytophagales bacterium]|jgi:arsenite-transporting ATPase|nr:arsenical pump-driving ATPase [Cytophagales bacterium]MCA6425044.1 arsenical pump-driving ATPase [Cytophagales bacterium]MCA6437082.1 arsenical pump-driving ATPase [Bacteroidota bacterium]MCA6445508.1 arsenical pump-driving ATPase [Bacteroidota bacterium]MCA6492908.1 arsenical pump-driving ATPase [Chitinophagaceae bacterium]
MTNTKTKYLFFTGKGGVGKTSLACATAVEMADSGKVVLLVSTDPASNLKDVLESPVDENIIPIRGINNLFAINIDPENSAEEYRNRVTRPLEGISSKEEIKKIREDLSGACTTEIASFDEFSRFVSSETEGTTFDVIIFDTAPTGHTLRLLELPAAWSSFTDENPDGASCLGPTSALKIGKERYHTVVNRLRDASLTSFYIVARADKASLKEASRTSNELKELGMSNQVLYINGVFKALDKNDLLAQKIETMGNEQLNSIPGNLKTLPLKTFPLLPYNVLGIVKLRSLFNTELQKSISENNLMKSETSIQVLKGIDQLVDELCEKQQYGLIMTMGKGGVGKTIAASAIAVLLANKGFEVLLTTTDPAAHLQDFIEQLGELPSTLTVERIDPKVETQRYTQKILEYKGQGQSEEAKNLILEDLKSPCTEEVAVFHAFSKAISMAKRKFVVMDTAPTGHTLLLLDTAGSYHRDIMRNNINAGRLRTPYMSLQDQTLSKIILVSLPETTPMREAGDLQNDLKRAGIQPYAWLINQSLSMLIGIKDPLLKSRANAEIQVINTIKGTYSERTFGIPFIAEKKLLPALLDRHLNKISI